MTFQHNTLDLHFLEAVGLSGTERDNYIEKLAQSNPEIAERVKQLLSGFTRFDTEADRAPNIVAPVLDSDATLTGGPPVFTFEEEISNPTHVGSYEVIRKIGQGGMGRVYLVREDLSGREVALKIIRRSDAGSEFLTRFQSEYRVLARMNHDNIARLYEAGATEHGEPYFTMEYVDGKGVTEYCEVRELSVKERLELFLQICDGVLYAHQKAIIHRDLKPSNVLVTEEGGAASVKLIDFGVAKELTPENTNSPHTIAGALLGTPAYMSPEQLEGKENIDTRVDIYALGVILYEILTDHPVYDPDELKEIPWDKALRRYREEDPDLPSTRLRQLSQDQPFLADRVNAVKGDLDAIVMKAMSKNIQERYATISALRTDVHRFLNNEPVSARPVTFMYATRKFVHRNKGLVLSAALILTAILTGFGLALRSSIIATRANQEAQLSLYRFQQINTFLEGMLTAPDPRERGLEIKVVDILGEAKKMLAAPELANDLYLQTSISTMLGRTYLGIGEYALAEQFFRSAIDLRESIPDSDPSFKADFGLGRVLMLTRRYREARTQFLTTIEAQMRTIGPEDPNTLKSRAGLGMTTSYIEEMRDEAKDILDKVWADQKRLLGEQNIDTIKTLEALASINTKMKNHKQAETQYRQALKALRETVGDEHPETLTCTKNLAFFLNSQKKFAEAERLYRTALAGRKKVQSIRHPQTMLAQYGLAYCLAIQGTENPDKLYEAISLMDELIPIRREINGPLHDDTFKAINLKGACLVGLGRYDEAYELIKPLLKKIETSAKSKNRQTNWTLDIYGDIQKAKKTN